MFKPSFHDDDDDDDGGRSIKMTLMAFVFYQKLNDSPID